jgi:tripartite-type tricarboxylate transporter receptor subunit TctC
MVAHGKGISRRAFVAVALAGTAPTAALAQADYPSRTVRIIVPLLPGAAADVIPRVVAEKLAAKWGQPVIVENRPGGRRPRWLPTGTSTASSDTIRARSSR